MILDIDNIPAPLLRMILDIDNIPSPLLTEKFSAVLAGQCYWLAAISEDSFFQKETTTFAF